MKGENFDIKIADLLNHLGTDTIVFDQLTTPLLPHLTEEGIRGTLILHSVDGQSVWVKIEDLECALQEVCEQCLQPFVRSVSVESYSAKFVLDTKELEESTEEVIFPIDKKGDIINIEEMLYQAVQLQAPFVIKCEACLGKMQ
ncbi:MAG: hypothetical protein LBP53_02675 [Candidatus Peribacteria bacterium]|jgi:uncharacterized metal-binding protein YceD (DUF177 family)|nr:hypothetical protein [Candidatus Peribacteria bacterium]